MSIHNLLKKIAYWTVPLGLQAWLIKKCKWFCLSRAIKYKFHENRKFRGQHKGKRCFILATGPSISSQDLTKLSEEFCIAVGEFYLHPQAASINPAYSIQAPNHMPFDENYVIENIKHSQKVYSKNTTYFFGHSQYKYSWFEVLKKNSEIAPKNTRFINYSGSEKLSSNNFTDSSNWDISGTPFICMTVVYSAIQLAIYMGFSEIYLLGCDHDYLERVLSKKGFKDHHFYSESPEETKVLEHLNDFTLAMWFEQYYFRWLQYELMDKYAKSKGQLILNATNGGMLDVFKRASLEAVLK
jgi:hypothetical protein